MKTIRPKEKEAPMESKRPARANPAKLEMVIRLALFVLALAIAGAAFVILRR